MSAEPIAVARLFLGPLLSFVGLPFLTAIGVLVTRLTDILLKGRDARYYEEYAGVGGSPVVDRMTRLLANAFEFPVLFLSVIGLSVTCAIGEPLLPILAWAYVALRWVHAIIRVSGRLNRLLIRVPVFMASNLVLLVMWVVLSLRILKRV